MYLEVCDKDVFDEFINGPNEKIWEMIDQNQDWNTIADFIEVFFMLLLSYFHRMVDDNLGPDRLAGQRLYIDPNNYRQPTL